MKLRSNISSGYQQEDYFYAFHTLDHPNIQRPHSDICYLFVRFGCTGRLIFASWCTEYQLCQLAKVVKQAVSAVTSIPILCKELQSSSHRFGGPFSGLIRELQTPIPHHYGRETYELAGRTWGPIPACLPTSTMVYHHCRPWPTDFIGHLRSIVQLLSFQPHHDTTPVVGKLLLKSS